MLEQHSFILKIPWENLEMEAENWLSEIHPDYTVALYEFQLKKTKIFPADMFSESVVSSLSADKWWHAMNIKQN